MMRLFYKDSERLEVLLSNGVNRIGPKMGKRITEEETWRETTSQISSSTLVSMMIKTVIFYDEVILRL